MEFQINGLREVDEQLQTVANHMVEISLPLSYPRLPPQCRMLTPVFHPNIAPHAICIGDHWSAGEPLWSMVARIGEMIAYQSYNTKSPLNGEAARWVEANQDRLPLDHTNFIMDMPASQPEPADPSIIPLADRSADFSPPLAATRRVDFRPPLTSAVRPVGEVDSNPPLASSAGPPSPPASIPRAVAPPVPMALPPQLPQPPAAPNIVIECGQCQSRYSVPATAGGRKVRCKKCQAILVIPLRQPLP